ERRGITVMPPMSTAGDVSSCTMASVEASRGTLQGSCRRCDDGAASVTPSPPPPPIHTRLWPPTPALRNLAQGSVGPSRWNAARGQRARRQALQADRIATTLLTASASRGASASAAAKERRTSARIGLRKAALRLNPEDTMREVEKYSHRPTSNGSPEQQSDGFRTNVEHQLTNRPKYWPSAHQIIAPSSA